MSAHEHFSDAYAAKVSGYHRINPPGDGEVIDLTGIDGGLLEYDIDTNVSAKVPRTDITGNGTSFFVSNIGTGTVTIKTQADSAIGTVSGDDVTEFRLSSNGVWSMSVSRAQIAGLTSSTGANLTGYDDSGNKTTAANVGDALDELFLDATGTARIGVPLVSISKEDGTQMIKQATTVTGFAQLSNKNIVIHIPANSTAEAFAASSNMPLDMASANNGDIVLNVVVSKSADTDVLTLQAELYARSLSGVSWSVNAYSGSAQAIVAAGSVLQFAAATSPAIGAVGQVAFVLTLGGTNDGDVVYIHDVFWTYRKTPLTS